RGAARDRLAGHRPRRLPARYGQQRVRSPFAGPLRRDGRDGRRRRGVRLTSPDVEEGGPLSTIHGYKFDNLSPGLAWSDVPAGAACLPLTLGDTHPVARGYVHWFVDGIPPVNGAFARGAGCAIPFGR